MTFNPSKLPEVATAVYDISGTRIGTYNPHTNVIHPTAASPYGALRLIGGIAVDMRGKLVGRFNEKGFLQPTQKASEVAVS